MPRSADVCRVQATTCEKAPRGQSPPSRRRATSRARSCTVHTKGQRRAPPRPCIVPTGFEVEPAAPGKAEGSGGTGGPRRGAFPVRLLRRERLIRRPRGPSHGADLTHCTPPTPPKPTLGPQSLVPRDVLWQRSHTPTVMTAAARRRRRELTVRLSGAAAGSAARRVGGASAVVDCTLAEASTSTQRAWQR